MSKITDLYDYFLQCPHLKSLLPITTEIERGKDVFIPRGSSPVYAIVNENVDVVGNYNSIMMPFPSIFEDWQINCYRYADPNDETQNGDNINIINHDDVEKICKWLFEKNAKKQLPEYGGEKVFGIIPTETKPGIWGADVDRQQIVYAITIRVYFVNPNERVEVEVDGY